MADTDIYKNREPLPMGNKPEKKRRRRRSESQRAFDDHSRKRRSSNSGLRRILHLSRKSENDKKIWIAAGIFLVALLIVVAIWQFVIVEYQVEKQEGAFSIFDGGKDSVR
ncbi:hypothetical protein P4C99_09885 [Pontiellaceae bacterium B1224]|nr:hypothetical protein [Pontiellaceae bacterium B1224]